MKLKIGTKIESLLIVGLADPYKSPKGQKHKVFSCKCDCGSMKNIRATHISNGKVKSCGCKMPYYVSSSKTTHGMSETEEYRIYSGMVDRCRNKNNRKHKNYGGRGIKVCDRWLNSFENFYEDMGKRPSNKHSIDRIDNNRGYSSKNCKWSLSSEQQRNKTDSIVFNGENAIDASKRLGGNIMLVASRVKNYGWSLEKAFNTPVNGSKD